MKIIQNHSNGRVLINGSLCIEQGDHREVSDDIANGGDVQSTLRAGWIRILDSTKEIKAAEVSEVQPGYSFDINPILGSDTYPEVKTPKEVWGEEVAPEAFDLNTEEVPVIKSKAKSKKAITE
jgi:hypothetical protein